MHSSGGIRATTDESDDNPYNLGPLINAKQAGQIARVNPNTIYKWGQRGSIRAIRDPRNHKCLYLQKQIAKLAQPG